MKDADFNFDAMEVTHQDVTYPLSSCDAESYAYFAMRGVIACCAHRTNPLDAFMEICAGNRSGRKPRNYPKVVQAIAEMLSISVEEANAKWLALPKDERMAIRTHPTVRRVVAGISERDPTAPSLGSLLGAETPPDPDDSRTGEGGYDLTLDQLLQAG